MMCGFFLVPPTGAGVIVVASLAKTIPATSRAELFHTLQTRAKHPVALAGSLLLGTRHPCLPN